MAEVVLSHVSERSFLSDPEAPPLTPFTVNGRKRLATCSGVSWFRGYHLAVVNLYGCHLRIYRFHPGEDGGGEPARVELLHELSEGISYPEDVAVSRDGKWVAVTHSMSDRSGVSLHSFDESSLGPSPVGETIRLGLAYHGVRFSPDSRHLAFTEVDWPGHVEVVRLEAGSWGRTCWFENRHASLKPKSVAFSHDARFVAIASALNVSQEGVGGASGGLLSVHRFDASAGQIADEALAELRGAGVGLGNPEMCTFLPGSPVNPYRILVADQGSDVVAEHEFDPTERTLAFTRVFADGLSFPHGLDASSDGRFVAITNYGDDTLRVCRISR